MKIKKILRQAVKGLMVQIYNIMAKVLPVRQNVILFESSMGRNYTGNPRAIYEEMVNQGLDKKYRIIWFFEDTKTKIPGKAKIVKHARFLYLYYFAIARVWVFDCRQPEFLVKKKETIYIQTWHGTPLKKLALDMDKVNMGGETDIEKYRSDFKKNTGTWDYLISQNEFSTKIFTSCFDFHKEFLQIGYPRNDVLFHGNKEENIRAIKKRMGIPLDKKVLLYAPTWRDNQFYNSKNYKFASQLDFDALREALEKEYVLIVKYHYLVKDTLDWSKYEGFIYQCNEKEEISSLYLVADALITDYSSVMFDYSLLNRPMFFFAYDLEAYRDELRGFYFDFINEVPGPISQTTEELIRDIKEYDATRWEEKWKLYHEKFNGVDDGSASRQVCHLIEGIVAGGDVTL